MRNRLAAAITALALVASCPAFSLGTPHVPTPAEVEAEQQAERKAEAEAAYHRSRLVAIVDGYKVWSIWDDARGGHLYVTTPCGNTQWKTIEGNGKVFRTIDHEMPSVECKP